MQEIGSRPRKERKFKSARLAGPYEKPCLEKREPRKIWDKIIFFTLSLVGWGSQHTSSILDGLHKNVYTDASGLHIVPTLTTDVTDITEAQLQNGYTLNLTALGTCTITSQDACVIMSNSTKGIIINPVRSARVNTKGRHSIGYGKVEVVAKLPKGDWIWPAIFIDSSLSLSALGTWFLTPDNSPSTFEEAIVNSRMMPENSTYGEWPRSGEIDIMESRGNDLSYKQGGRNEVSGTLHWGPDSSMDAYWHTSSSRQMKHGDYSDGFHTYGLEWSENYLYTYVDNRLVQSLYVPFGSSHGSMYERGGYTTQNPWVESTSTTKNAPFDQSFYLILNVAVGSTSSYFPDGIGSKPWSDTNSTIAMQQFWAAKNDWLPTWGDGDARGMAVSSVEMWSGGACGSSYSSL
ncbi:hypothetical protein AB5N19_09577 [Seiridium cardinale]